MRSTHGAAQLVNDQTVQKKGPNATATVTITFHKAGGPNDMEEETAVSVSFGGFEAIETNKQALYSQCISPNNHSVELLQYCL